MKLKKPPLVVKCALIDNNIYLYVSIYTHVSVHMHAHTHTHTLIYLYITFFFFKAGVQDRSSEKNTKETIDVGCSKDSKTSHRLLD